MPRGGGRRSGGGGSSFGGGGGRQYSSKPPARDSSPRTAPNQAPKGGGGGGSWGGGGGGGGGFMGTVAGSFFGAALGNVVGHAIASSMFRGRDPDTGEFTDRKLAEDNPCKRELDYFIQCAKYVEDPSLCKGPSEALKNCAERHKDYFQPSNGE